jgi:hypothetical protein
MLASPYVSENSYTEAGNPNPMLALTVRVRESEAQGNVTFDLPVYAVDQSGALVDATGYFKGEIEGVTSDCGDCVMVNGRATIRVTIPVAKDASFDLSSFKLYATPDCSWDANWVQTTFGALRGCTNVTASYDAPTGLQNIEPFPYPLSPNALAAFNTLAQGGDIAERQAFYKNFADTTIGVVKFGLNFLPFISDGVDMLGQAYNAATGQAVDPVLATLAMAGLVLDTLTGGVGDVTALFKASYKLSLDAGGVVARVMRDEVVSLVAGSIAPSQFIDTLKLRLKTLLDFNLTPGCGTFGLGCAKQYDEIGLTIKNTEGLGDSAALSKLDTNYLKESRYEALGLTNKERLDDLEASAVRCLLQTLSLSSSIDTLANPCPRSITKDAQGRVTKLVASLNAAFINGGTGTTVAARKWTRGTATVVGAGY